MRIPHTSILNIGNALSTPFAKEILSVFSNLSIDNDEYMDLMTAELLFWIYMSEQLHNSKSFFYPYLQCLSHPPPNPHYWSPSILKCLKGTNLEILNGAQTLLRDQSNMLMSLIPHLTYLPSDQLGIIFSFESLAWAKGHYHSRGYTP